MSTLLQAHDGFLANRGEIPDVFSMLWKQVPDDAVGYAALLKKAGFLSKAELQKFSLDQVVEGRFYWKDGEQRFNEFRWQQVRQFDGKLKWHFVVIGPTSLADHCFKSEEGVQCNEKKPIKVFLEHNRHPSCSFQFPELSDRNTTIQMEQHIWSKDGLPFYYQWVGMVPLTNE